jgi:hypothetical protein
VCASIIVGKSPEMADSWRCRILLLGLGVVDATDRCRRLWVPLVPCSIRCGKIGLSVGRSSGFVVAPVSRMAVLGLL